MVSKNAIAGETIQNTSHDVEIRKQKAKTGKCVTYLTDFANDVEVLGLKHVSAKGTPLLRRGFYFCLVFFGIIFAGYQIHAQVNLYLDYPQNTFVDYEFVERTVFPKVVLCNLNMVCIRPIKGGKDIECRVQIFGNAECQL